MSLRQLIEDRLSASQGVPVSVGALGADPLTARVPVYRICYSTAGDISILPHSPSDTAIYFEGFHCPLKDATFLIDKEVAADWGMLGGFAGA